MKLILEVGWPWIMDCKRFTLFKFGFDWIDKFCVHLIIFSVGIYIEI